MEPVDLDKEPLEDQPIAMGVMFADELAERFRAEDEGVMLQIRAILNAAWRLHRNNPGSTEELLKNIAWLEKHINRDRDFIVKNKLPGWERYQAPDADGKA